MLRLARCCVDANTTDPPLTFTDRVSPVAPASLKKVAVPAVLVKVVPLDQFCVPPMVAVPLLLKLPVSMTVPVWKKVPELVTVLADNVPRSWKVPALMNVDPFMMKKRSPVPPLTIPVGVVDRLLK